LGHVIAERAGHAMHTALVARIMSDPSIYEILTFDQLASREVWHGSPGLSERTTQCNLHLTN
jgi:UDP-3-O-acyl-N-acetylglucosamine deacetylase